MNNRTIFGVSRAVVCAAGIALAGCATVSGRATDTQKVSEETELLAVMDAYMRAISTQDFAAMAASQTPEGMSYRVRRRDDGGWDVVARPNSYWVAPERADSRTYRERYWSPTVLIRGGMAMVWAPYEFRIEGKTSHCGVDAFSFVRLDGTWKVSNSMWTVEPQACTELRPASANMIRPAD